MTFKRVLAIFLCSLFLYCNIGEISYAANSSTDAKKVEQERRAIRQKIDSLAKLERKESNKLSRNQQKLEKNQIALQKSKNQYTKKQESISKLQKELDSYLGEYNKRNKASAERIRCIYKNQHPLILDLLLTTTTVSEFMDRIYYQNLIIQSDKAKMNNLKDEATRIASLKQRLERERRQLSGIIKNINSENANISKTIKQNKAMIAKIQNDKKAYERSERELQRLSDNLTTIISKQTKDSGVVVGGGFILPVNGARVSSPYGTRIHPIFKTKTFHSGIDFAAPYGTPIKASNAGKVIYSGWYGGYGKVVILDHGSCTGAPTTTLYAHMSRQNVSVGDTVTRGQTIGFIGSTGYSTGPHVHFELRINGKHVNPNRYL
ncbi:peptidoglycan DD-metalloendopeptidase family protein [bacterium]|nr:peptidoglycan DD-metalloendopeptidase family protein [bacterium]